MNRSIATLMSAAVLMAASTAISSLRAEEPVFPEFQDNFPLFGCKLSPIGVNAYFMPLIPGYKLLFTGVNEDDEPEVLLITVLRRTKVVDGVRCAVVREMEWADGELGEISWNYLAICRKHDDIFYYGEDVDIYEDGEVVSHDGAWRAGVNGAKPGLIMPGYPLVGSRYFQEIAPDVALDRAEHLSVTELAAVPAGVFGHCLFVEESSPLEPGHFSYKTYAPGVGLIKDNILELVAYGYRVHRPAWCHGGNEDED